MKNLPKILILIVAILAFLGLGLGVYFFRQKIPFIAPRQKKVTLSYWGLFEPPEVVKPLIAEYQKENPHVTIDYQPQTYTSFSQYKKTLYNRLKEGSGPDIARVHASWIPQFEDLISPLPADIMSSSEYGKRFLPVTSQACQVRGSTYCIPLMYDGLVLLYNKSLFSEAAVASPPETWKEFRDIAVKLTQWEENDPQKRILQAGAAIGAADNVDHAPDILGLMLVQSEVSIPTQLSSQAAQDVFTFYTNFARKDHVWDETWPDSLSAFASGKVGMIFADSWEVALLKSKKLGFSLGVAPVPQVPKLEGGLTSAGWANFWVESVFLDSGKAREAWKFLKFLSEKTSQEELANGEKRVRGLPFPSSRNDLVSTVTANSYLAPVLKYASGAKFASFSSCAGNPDYESIILKATNDILKGSPVGESLQEAEKALTSLIGSRSLGTTTSERACLLTSFGWGEMPEVAEVPPAETTPSATPETKPVPAGTPAPTVTPPVVPLSCQALTASPRQGEVPLKVTFTARASDTSRVHGYRFAFGDGVVSETSQAAATHTYSTAGTYTATVRIKDEKGILTPETPLCQATISAQRPAVATTSARPTTGFTPPLLVVSLLSTLLLVLGILF